MAAKSTEHQDNQEIISLKVDPSRHLIVSLIINKPQELPSHPNGNQSSENEDGAADDEEIDYTESEIPESTLTCKRMAASWSSTEHQDNQQIIPLEVDPSRHMIVSLIIKPQEPPSHHNESEPSENEDDAADEEINSTELAKVELKRYQPLYLAALQGNWEFASQFFDRDPVAFRAKISLFSMTVLHAAAYNGQTEFVEKMLLDERLPYEVLAMRDADGLTALHYAAMAGNIRIAKALVTKDSSLTQIADHKDYTPLLTACAVAPECKDLVRYLVTKTKDVPPASPFTGEKAGRLISCLAYARLHDISLYLVGRYPDLATAVDSDDNTLLRAMAEEPSNFKSGHTFSFWERWIYQIVPAEPIATVSRPLKGDMEEPPQNSRSYAETPVWRTYGHQVLRWLKMSSWEVIEKSVPFIRQIRNTKSSHKLAMDLVETVCQQVSKKSNEEMLQYYHGHDILVTAVINGVVEIVMVCLEYFPDLIWLPVEDQTLMVHAVKHRQEKIFNLLYERTTLSKRQAYSNMKTDHNVLIQAAKLSPQPRLTIVSGAALQMQRELQWFEAVESMLNPSVKREKLDNGKTAWQTFQEEHKFLLKEGQEWMKNTSNSCMLVAALIATVVFTAAFTVPGGNVSDEGIPIFLMKTSFLVFAVSDALALFSSVTSILMFLSVLTSRYAAEDFRKSLPLKLIIGLFSLFFAIAAMMVAFGATLSIILGETRKWLPIVLLGLFPVILFLKLQLGLFIEMCRSTYGKGIFHPQKPW